MNEKLTFSWGHIIAFFAIILVSYFSFMGFMYLTNGNFFASIMGMILIDAVYLFVFLAAQLMKGSGNNISSKILWERIFVFSSPAVFIAGMIVIAHFWTVQSRSSEIVSTFKDSVGNTQQLFDDYEAYANERLKNYENGLRNIIANKSNNPEAFARAGFQDGMEQIQYNNMVETLRLQLLSDNYEKLRDGAEEWIEDAADGASVWNVFLLGNKREIRDAVETWDEDLHNSTTHVLSNEEMAGPVKEFKSEAAKEAIEGIDSLDESYTTMGFPTVFAIIFGILLYLMLLFPYLIQQRHGRQVAMRYSLWKSGELDNTMGDRDMPVSRTRSRSYNDDNDDYSDGPRKRKFSRLTLD